MFEMNLDFKEMVESSRPIALKLEMLGTLQVNLGNRCNQKCAHCHVEAGPNGNKIMSRGVMVEVIDFLKRRKGLVVDVTGGCPELNPNFRFFIEKAAKLASTVMVRTNLTVLLEPGLDWVSSWYRDNQVVVIGSLPCYTQADVDAQRGRGVFEKSICALKKLNGLGYGFGDSLELDLVYNPVGGFLPGSQQQLEADYKKELGGKYGIRFNRLFAITNASIGRFKQFLEANGHLEQYQQLLRENFNPCTIDDLMCRRQISVDYRGILYNCDFNQALDLPIVEVRGQIVTIDNVEDVLGEGVDIINAEHCFCCTAGAGSICTGSLIE